MTARPETSQEFYARINADGAACLEAALEYLKMGWAPLPLCGPDHIGIERVSKKHTENCGENRGKRPWILWSRYEDELPDENEVRYWWKQLPTSNVGVALGPVSGIVRVDIDGASGEQALLERSKGDLPPTLEFRSGRADGTGRGLIYRIPPGVRTRTTRGQYGVKAELRFQARGAQTVMPPSRHKDGGLYAWVPGHGPQETEAALMPAWVIEALKAEPGRDGHSNGHYRTAGDWEEIFSGVAEGQRNDSMAAIIGKLLSGISDLDNSGQIQPVWFSVQAINAQNSPPLDQSELVTIFKSIFSAEKAKRLKGSPKDFGRAVIQQVDASASEKNGAPQEATPDGIPDWDLIIVGNDPFEYLLRSPYWSDCQNLKGGYLALSAAEIFNWAGLASIRRAAWMQAAVIIPPTLKEWNLPDGPLERLKNIATARQAPPETSRRLSIVGFIYRYLRDARSLYVEDADKPRWPLTGAATIDPDGDVFFKLPHLKTHVACTHEDFKQRELMAIIREFGEEAYPDGNRWWVVRKIQVAIMGRCAREVTVNEANNVPI